MSKHTKEPWEIVGAETPGYAHEIYGDGYWIASIAHGAIKDDDIANARLIAAAPELLDVLKKILAAHESGNNGAIMGEAVLCNYFATRAKNAIAKAEGGK